MMYDAPFVYKRGGDIAHIRNHAKDGVLCGAEPDFDDGCWWAPLDPPLCKKCLGPGRPVRPHGSGPS